LHHRRSACLAALSIGWTVGRLMSRPALPAVTPSPLPASEAVVSLVDVSSVCWHPGLARNAGIAIEPGCE